MANNANVYQCARNVSIPREALSCIAKSDKFTTDEYRVLLMLFTQLDGFTNTTDETKKIDPHNFKQIDIKQISENLGMKKKEVKRCIDSIYHTEIETNTGGSRYMLDRGDNATVKDGYRFTF